MFEEVFQLVIAILLAMDSGEALKSTASAAFYPKKDQQLHTQSG